jgi:uncharacterized protein (TIGR04255 family)
MAMNYNNAPVKEAIFDIRINKLEKSNLKKLEAIFDDISDKYPNKRKKVTFKNTVEIKNNIPTNNETNSEDIGYIFSSQDNKRQVQIRLDGFTFNMLSPYSDWDEFSTEAFRLWSLYSKALNPSSISRIALRYINKIEIPLPMERFQDYIINIPPIPSNLPQSFHHFFMQLEVPCDKSGTNIVITETIEQQKNDKILPFILDIDVYKADLVDLELSSLEKEFLKLRNIKNETFESCITERTRKLLN